VAEQVTRAFDSATPDEARTDALATLADAAGYWLDTDRPEGAPNEVDAARIDLVADAEAARAYLAARSEIVSSRIGLAGASIGASIATIVAANDPSIRTLALLSPALDYRGIRIEQSMRKYGSRPALLVASSEDAYALRSARDMVSMGDGQRELRVLWNKGHGTVMLVQEPDLSAALVDWFVRTLL
jgi:pimeloyl-ACP methyl ester carboxylesterase